jgi:superfamily II DNA or RNA helicase
MSQLRSLGLKTVYTSEDDSILEDFYLPALSVSKSYDRTVGYFSSAMLSHAAQGISCLIKNGGKMRLVIGAQLSPEDFEAVKEGRNIAENLAKISLENERMLDGISDELAQHRLELLSWLVSIGRLQIKYAIRMVGMEHKKIGILYDESGDHVVMHGSNNESENAIFHNGESFSVYFSWRPEIMDGYGSIHKRSFERLWTNTNKNTVVIDVPSTLYDKLKALKQTNNCPDLTIEAQIYKQLVNAKEGNPTPKMPSFLHSRKFGLLPHQQKALQEWKANCYQGIFKLATGAGKTVTSIYGVVKLYNANKKLFVVIAVPYLNLAAQWGEVLNLFGIYPIPCYIRKENWYEELSDAVRSFNIGAADFKCVVVVNKTLTSEPFQEIINRLNLDSERASLFIGDECHHHDGPSYKNKLPQFTLRLGLSATPYPEDEYEDQEGNNKEIVDYYGPIVSEYSIDDALKDEVLSPYKYHIHPVYLTEKETDTYIEKTDKINQLIAIKSEGGSISKDSLKFLILARARLLGNASNKLGTLSKILDKTEKTPHSLFYCGDGFVEDENNGSYSRQISLLSQLLHDHGWRTSQFTANEKNMERNRILDGFKAESIDALVAIKVLDEGIDIPSCKTAFLLASSRNPRQFIQRRGRILRKHPGKEHAIIHDFMVLPCQHLNTVKATKELVSKEIDRAVEFIRLCINKSEVHDVIDPLADKFNLLPKTVYSTS